MELGNVNALDLGQIAALLAVLWKLFLKNSDTTSQVSHKVAVLEEKVKDYKEDHDKIVELTASYRALHQRMDTLEATRGKSTSRS